VSLTEIPAHHDHTYTEDEEAFIMHMKLKEASDKGEDLLKFNVKDKCDENLDLSNLVEQLKIEKDKLTRQLNTLNLEKQLERTEKLKYIQEASSLRALLESDAFLFSRL